MDNMDNNEKQDDLYFDKKDIEEYADNERVADFASKVFLGTFLANGAISILVSILTILNGKKSFAPFVPFSAAATGLIMYVVSLVEKIKNRNLKNQLLAKLEEIKKTPVFAEFEQEDEQNVKD